MNERLRMVWVWVSLLWRPRALWAIARISWLIVRVRLTNFLSGGAVDAHLKTMEEQIQVEEMRKILEQESKR